LYLPILLCIIAVMLLPGANLILENSSFRIMYKLCESWGDKLVGFSLCDDTIAVVFIPYVLIGTALITAFLLFGFLFSKKAQAVYFLTGISRGQLFAIRYLFGAISLAAALFIAFAVSVVMNIAMTGITDYLFVNALYLFIAMFSLSFCCYSLCVVIMTVCGRGIEYFISAVWMLSVPSLILLFLQNVSSAFLLGAPYYFGQGNVQSQYYPSIFEKYSRISCFDVFSDSFKSCASAYGHADGPDFITAAEGFIYRPQTVLLMLAFGILFGFIGMILLKRRRAELSEQPNACSILSKAVTLTTSVSLSSCVFFLGGKFIYLIAFVLCTAVIAFALTVVFRAGIRGVRKALLIPLSAVLFGCAFCLVCFFGGFGYSSYIPPIDEIEYVQMSFPGHPQYAPTNSGHSTISGSYFYMHHTSPEHQPRLSTADDIETAVSIHRAMIDDSSRKVSEGTEENFGDTAVYSDIYITYTLKNGRQVTRFYRTLKMSTLEKVLELEITEEYSSHLESNIRYFGEDKMGWSNDEAILKEIASQSKVYAADNLLANLTLLSLTEEEKNEFFDAILRDKSDDTVKERYFPKKECLGVLFVTYGEIDMTGDLERSFDILGQYYGTSNIYIYEEDTETLAYLKEKGFYSAFEKEYEIQKIELYDASLYPSHNWRPYNAYNRSFYSKVNARLTADFLPIRDLDSGEYGDILRDSRLCHFMDGGNLVVITFTNADGEVRITTKYLPRASA